jgi:hypothetical protein
LFCANGVSSKIPWKAARDHRGNRVAACVMNPSCFRAVIEEVALALDKNVGHFRIGLYWLHGSSSQEFLVFLPLPRISFTEAKPVLLSHRRFHQIT